MRVSFENFGSLFGLLPALEQNWSDVAFRNAFVAVEPFARVPATDKEQSPVASITSEFLALDLIDGCIDGGSHFIECQLCSPVHGCI